jgi:hypothetical protein
MLFRSRVIVRSFVNAGLILHSKAILKLEKTMKAKMAMPFLGTLLLAGAAYAQETDRVQEGRSHRHQDGNLDRGVRSPARGH